MTLQLNIFSFRILNMLSVGATTSFGDDNNKATPKLRPQILRLKVEQFLIFPRSSTPPSILKIIMSPPIYSPSSVDVSVSL